MQNTKNSNLLNTKVITNKFGEIAINLDAAISLPQGVLGFPEQKEYFVVPCPIQKFSNFVLLQSAEQDNLVFMALPIDLQVQTILKAEDISEGALQAGIEKGELAIVLIASTKMLEETGQKVITVNAKAPIFIDTKNKTAKQVVFQSTEYDVQHIL